MLTAKPLLILVNGSKILDSGNDNISEYII